MSWRNRRGETTIVRVYERDVLTQADSEDGQPRWQCPHCRQLQFRGFVQVGRHVETVCRRHQCSATIRYEVVDDLPPVTAIGRHRHHGEPVADAA